MHLACNCPIGIWGKVEGSKQVVKKKKAVVGFWGGK